MPSYVSLYLAPLTTVWSLINHMTLGLGKPVTLQQNLAQSPSLTVTGSGLLTKTGDSLSFSSSIFSSGAICHEASISLIFSILFMPLGN
uniref:Putative secreted protein n=1 Tax=Panstrongylus lignarius TaxID=156445 RepID=A0A224Y470_9HEMI